MESPRRPVLPRGFSLLELLVVMTLLGIVFLYALPRLTGAVEQRSVRNARAAVANLFARARVHAIQARTPTTLELNGNTVVITAQRSAKRDTIGGVADLGREFRVAVAVTGGPVVIAPNGLVRSGLPLRAIFTRAAKADTLQLLGYGQVQ